MQIDIEPGKKDSIFVSQGDIPSILAMNFCMKNQLDLSVSDYLTE